MLAACSEAPVSIVGLILVLISFGISPNRVSCWNLVQLVVSWFVTYLRDLQTTFRDCDLGDDCRL